MAKTFEEPRPTPVTVIGWAWIILGLVMLLSATGGLITQVFVPSPDPADFPEDVPFAAVWRYFEVLLAAQGLLAIVGIVAGRRFLKLERRARGALEILSWILLSALLGFAITWVVNATAMFGDDAGGLSVVFIIPGVMVTAIYGVPVGLMIYHLRSDRVRQALG